MRREGVISGGEGEGVASGGEMWGEGKYECEERVCVRGCVRRKLFYGIDLAIITIYLHFVKALLLIHQPGHLSFFR